MFVLSLVLAAYLGFALIHLPHDKLVHFVTFFVLTAEFYWLWVAPPVVVAAGTLVVCTLGASVVSEVLQGYVNPQRVFDAGDIVSNLLGSLAALVACAGGRWLLNKRATTTTGIYSGGSHELATV